MPLLQDFMFVKFSPCSIPPDLTPPHTPILILIIPSIQFLLPLSLTLLPTLSKGFLVCVNWEKGASFAMDNIQQMIFIKHTNCLATATCY